MSGGISGRAASAGLGITEMTREYTGDAATLALRVVRLALEDAGLAKGDLDGLLVNGGVSTTVPYEPGAIGLGLQAAGGKPMRHLRNPWSDAWEEPGAPRAMPMPMQGLLVADAMRSASQ